ncbi:MAG: FAD-dependent oxidoreductase [Candidatus Syntropharchaeia archaeon]
MMERYAFFKRYSNHHFGIDREIPRCTASCPAGLDVKGYLALIAERKYKEAYSLIKEVIPFPGILGRICHHPCEQNCKRGIFDEPIAIAWLKRFVADNFSGSEIKRKEGNKKVAIVGSGPAGITAAIDLMKNGCIVTIFEAEERVSRILRLIPRFELPEDVLEEELNEALKGIEVKTNCTIGKDIKIEDLKKEYNAILIATGLQKSRSPEIPGSDLEGVVLALQFLENVNRGRKVKTGERVVVIGGGNVAIDVARSAVRLGAKVQIVCLESREEMPSYEWKISDALEEGIVIHNSWGVKEIFGDRRVERIRFVRCVSVFDDEGRFSPRFDENEVFELPADTIIFAIGQSSDLSCIEGTGIQTSRGTIKVDPLTLMTTEEGIFAAGDIVRGPASVVEAIADGHRAAESIRRFLNDIDLREGRTLCTIPEDFLDEIEVELKKEEERGFISRKSREKMPKIRIEERKKSFREVELGYQEESAISEAERCFSCRTCLFSPFVLQKEEVDIEGLIDETRANMCIECGKCTTLCPVAAIDPDFTPRLLVVRALAGMMEGLTEDEMIWKCNTCGTCDAFCPYGVKYTEFVRGIRRMALNMPRFSEKGLVLVEKQKGNRLGWLTDDLRISDKGEVYYFAGCISYLEEVYKERKNLKISEIPRSAVKILNSMGITPAVSAEEMCCGHDLLWSGNKKDFEELARKNMEIIRKSGAKTVIFTCAECLRTFVVDYREIFGDTEIEFVHISEFLLDKELPLKEGSEKLTYHDPCRLGRHLGKYDAPREILKKIGELTEMEHSRENSMCCGVGGLLTCGGVAREMQIKILKEAKKVGADKLITACTKCWIHLDCAISSKSHVDIPIEDFTIEIAKNLEW